jgi:hypothetical protein
MWRPPLSAQNESSAQGERIGTRAAMDAAAAATEFLPWGKNV